MIMLNHTESCSLETITPVKAMELLSKNAENNRKLNKTTITSYAKAMRSYNWTLSDSAIVISKEGFLLNGQHRLSACVESGIPFRSIILCGVDSNLIHGMDRGRVRTALDSFQMAGNIELANKGIIAIARFLIVGAGKGSSRSVQDYEIERMYADHKDALDFASDVTNSSIRGISRAGVGGAIACAYAVETFDKLLEFKYALIGRSDNVPQSISLLIRFLVGGRRSGLGGSGQYQDFLLTQKVIYEFCRGNRIVRLVAPKSPLYPILKALQD